VVTRNAPCFVALKQLLAVIGMGRPDRNAGLKPMSEIDDTATPNGLQQRLCGGRCTTILAR
jgi:hypothetical protein